MANENKKHRPRVNSIMAFSIISGTNRRGNLSIQVAKHYKTILQQQGFTSEIHTLEHLPLDIGTAEMYGKPCPGFAPFQEMVDQNRNFIFVVPEYNGSIPGILKLFIDACAYPRSFADKRAALVGVSAGDMGNRTGLSHLEDILNFLGTEVLPEKVCAGKLRNKIDAEGQITDTDLLHELETQASALAGFALSMPG